MRTKQNGLVLGIILSAIIYMIASDGWAASKVFDNPDQYRFCHRCGMAIKKSDHVIMVNDVPAAPWYQCCPVCALMDIIESAKGNGSIKGVDHINGRPIEVVIKNSKINDINPSSATILVGGSCPKNKFFADRKTGLAFLEKTDWAKAEMLKTVPQVFASLLDKRKAITRCAMCSTTLEGHEKTHFTIMTKEKKRLVACCGHCGLLMMHKLKNKVIRAVTPDFGTGRLIDAKKAFYVVDNDQVVCCFPSTISFAERDDAEAFQKKHNGVVMTFEQTQANMQKVMGK
jgi:hypothetical protein